jgi:hypothetical protein
MTGSEMDDDVVVEAGSYEQRMLDYAERQTRALERVHLILWLLTFALIVGGVLGAIAVLGSR